MSDEAVVAYCRARERLREAERVTKDARAEQADAQRTLGGLLGESMRRNAVDCVALPDGGGAVRLLPPARRAMTLATVDDALSLVADAARHLTEVPSEKLGAALVRLVRQRALERGPPPAAAPRLSLAAKPPKAVAATAWQEAPPETRRLMGEYREARAECARTRAELRPLREAKREAERALLPALEAPAVVSMAGAADAAAATRLTVEKVASKPRASSSSTSAKKLLGMREFVSVVRQACEEVLASTGREGFDAALREAVRRGLEAREPPPPKFFLRLRKEKKRPGG